MKILCFIDSLGSGGAQRQIVELSKGFKKRGHDVEVLIYHDFTFYKEDLSNNGINLKLISSKNYLSRIFKIRKYIRSQNPDVVLSFLQTPSFIATISGFPFRSWKLIVGERNADPNISKTFKNKLFRFLHLFTDYVVGNSQANIDLVKKVNPLISKNKIKVIYNIVDIDIANNITIKEETKTRITVAGRYENQKNYLGLIEALNLLPDDYKNKIKIECFGYINLNNKYYQECLKKIKEYRLEAIINLNDATSQIIKEYIKSDFVALFSYYEGFPNVIGEAMSLGKPVIMTNVSDIPIILKDNVNGYICDPYNINSIVDVLIKSIDSNFEERKYFGINNILLAKEKFEKNVIIDSYINLFK